MILNAANSTVGQVVIQLCSVLRLRCIAVVRSSNSGATADEKLVAWLKSLGAMEVVFEDRPLKVTETHCWSVRDLFLFGPWGCSLMAQAEGHWCV